MSTKRTTVGKINPILPPGGTIPPPPSGFQSSAPRKKLIEPSNQIVFFSLGFDHILTKYEHWEKSRGSAGGLQSWVDFTKNEFAPDDQSPLSTKKLMEPI